MLDGASHRMGVRLSAQFTEESGSDFAETALIRMLGELVYKKDQ